MWKRQYRLIFSALIGAMTTNLQPIVSRATTASQIWQTLANTYAKPSRGHLMQLRDQIRSWKKENKTIDTYIQGLTTRFDQLALLGKPFDHEDQIEAILKGLPEDYKTVKDQIEGRDMPPSIMEIHERLINHELRLASLPPPSVTPFPVTANVAQQRQNNNSNTRNFRNGNNNNNYRGSSSNWQTPTSTNRNQGRGSRPYLGRCQICGTQGHGAKHCPQLQTFQANQSMQQTSPFTPWQPRANLAVNAPYNAENWLLDSGATHHLTADLNNLSLHQQYHGGDDVTIADGSNLPITHTGSKLLPSPTKNLLLNKVLCVPNVHRNLISVYRLCNTNNVSVEFFPASFQVKDLSSGVPLLQGSTKQGLYEWPITKFQAVAMLTSSNPKATMSLWHSRLGHPHTSVLNNTITQFALPLLHSNQKAFSCSDCLSNKSHKQPFSQSTIVSTKPLQYIFSDLWSSPILSTENHKYYLLLVDHYTRYSWLYPLQKKSEVKAIFQTFKPLVENRFNTKIGTLFSDNGGEYIALKSYLAEQGISHLTTPPHTPEHNGLSERKHRHIVETGLTLLSKASAPKSYWPYAFSTAVYLINRMPTTVLQQKSPYQKLFQTNPNYEKLKVFGCLCFPWLRPYNSHKLEDRSKPCIFLGYSTMQSAYYCLHEPTGRIFTSRHVNFVEDQFPFATLKDSASVAAEIPQVNPTSPPHQVIPTAPRQTTTPVTAPSSILHQATPETTTPPPSTISQVRTSNLFLSQSQTHSGPSVQHNNGLNSQAQQPNPENQTLDQTLTQPNMAQVASNPTQVQPTQQNQNPSSSSLPSQSQTSEQNPNTQINPPPIPIIQNHHPMQTRAKNKITKPTQKLTLLASTTTLSSEPTTITQALKDKEWRQAASAEYDAHIRNHTWDLVPAAPNQNLVGCRWIFTTKYLPNGKEERKKGRLVAKGYNQLYGVDYTETFSPVIKTTTIRLVLDIAVTKDWIIKQLDVNNAFLQGDLQEEVYMIQPPGFIDTDRPSQVCRLRKAIYGLKQAPRAWYMALKQHLTATGFRNSHADASLFTKIVNGSYTYVLIYVDDIIVTGNNNLVIDMVLKTLADRFSIKDPTYLHYFLGVEGTRTEAGLHLSQRKYIVDLLNKTKMHDAKPVTTPLPTSPKLTLHSGTPLQDITEYRSVVGSLQYLAFTRPDISYAVSRLSQYMHRPTTEHWQAAKRVLRYLAGTSSHGILLSRRSPLTLHGFSDADWAGDTDDYVSTNAYVIYLGTNPVSWSSKKQQGVVRSSTEAEYRAVANTASEIRWLCSILYELGIRLPVSPVIYCDNVGATYLCANPVFHSRMKHIALDYHFIRNLIQAGALRVSHVSTHDQLADALTKPLARSKFHQACSKIGVAKPPPSCGSVLRKQV